MSQDARATAAENGPRLEHLERQLERGSLFLHTALGRGAIRVQEIESFAYGLLDVMLAKGIVSAEEVTSAASRVRQESVDRGEAVEPGVALRMDGPEAVHAPDVTVNCAERMHICHSACCKLDFPLTAAEVESGGIRWDLGRPYHIRHEADGFCTHFDRGAQLCGVHEQRPGVCRGYSCAHDQRIWKDFEKMEINTEWLEQHLSQTSEPQITTAMLYQIERARREDEPGK